MLRSILLSILLFSFTYAEEVCFYKNASGKEIIVDSFKKVPSIYRSRSRCFKKEKRQNLANPEEIDLEGSKREQSFSTSLGQVNLRWARKVEKLFGRTPVRAVGDAMRTAQRFLNIRGFDSKVRRMQPEWQIIFMDENLPEHQIPEYLVDNCHPGWMLPPTKIYIVAQRVAGSCSGKGVNKKIVADGDLIKVLLHEIGHSVEYQLLNQKQNQRSLAEGFASWFEQESSNYSHLVDRNSVKQEYYNLAKASFKNNPQFVFDGSSYAYARASLYYHAIVRRGSIGHLMDIYDYQNQGIDFLSAVDKRMGWSAKRFEEEVRRVID